MEPFPSHEKICKVLIFHYVEKYDRISHSITFVPEISLVTISQDYKKTAKKKKMRSQQDGRQHAVWQVLTELSADILPLICLTLIALCCVFIIYNLRTM